MNYKGMEETLKDINQLEEQVETIALSDNGQYQYFLNEIVALKQKMYELDVDDKDIGWIEDGELVRKIENLKFEFEQYLKTGQRDYSQTKLTLSKDDRKTSGNKNKKQYKINLYKSILEDLKKSSLIDLEKLEKLRKKWEEEKKEDKYFSPAEIDRIEEAFSDVFFEYQLKSLQKDKALLRENVAEFCQKEKYGKRLRKELLKTIQNLEAGTTKRLDLEQLYTSGTIEEIANNKQFWSIISGIEIKEDINLEFYAPAKIEPAQNNFNLSTIPEAPKPISISKENKLITALQRKNGTIQGIIRIPFLGKNIEFRKKFKLNKEGKPQIAEMWKDKIIAIGVSEGITEIKSESFQYLKNLKKAYLSETVKKIGENAFRDCRELEEVYLPEGLEKIGESAFSSCQKLEEIHLPESLKEIGKSTFYFCKNLKEIDLKHTQLTTIPTSSFSKCYQLTTVELPPLIQKIEKEAFSNSGLQTITFSPQLKSIGEGAFSKSNLNFVELPESVNFIGAKCFAACQQLKKVKMSSNLEVIPEQAFSECINLTDVSLPTNLRKIERKAFFGNKILPNIKLPRKIRDIEIGAFKDCFSLEEVEVDQNNTRTYPGAFPPGTKFKKVTSQQGDGDENQQGVATARGIMTNHEKEENKKETEDEWTL